MNESQEIRLPELPVFKRFSLALRQEFATADEILAMLDRTRARVEVLVAKEEKRRAAKEGGRTIAETSDAPDEVDEAEEDLVESGEDETADPAPVQVEPESGVNKKRRTKPKSVRRLDVVIVPQGRKVKRVKSKPSVARTKSKTASKRGTSKSRKR